LGNRFDSEGIDGLRIKPGRGRRSLISEEQKECLKTDLSQSPEIFGYNTANWSGPLLRRHLEVSCQVFYRQAAVYVLLHEPVFRFNAHAADTLKGTKSSEKQPKQI
jgi:transposase